MKRAGRTDRDTHVCKSVPGDKRLRTRLLVWVSGMESSTLRIKGGKELLIYSNMIFVTLKKSFILMREQYNIIIYFLKYPSIQTMLFETSVNVISEHSLKIYVKLV